MNISRDEWMRALTEANEESERERSAENQDALTVVEFGQMIGIQRCQAARRMNQLVAAGKAVRVFKRMRRSIGGSITVPAYRLVKAKPKAKR